MKTEWTVGHRRAYSLAAFVALISTVVYGSEWSEPANVKLRRDTVASYRATLDGDLLVVEVKHAAGWHTYAMDNVVRAREKSGRENPETELPTKILVSGGLAVAGPWHQSEPNDLSMTEIEWYTWGFENTARFAVKVNRVEGETAHIVISGQVCNDKSCAMVDELKLTVSLGRKRTEKSFTDLTKFVEVKEEK